MKLLQLLNKRKLLHKIAQQDSLKRNSQNIIPMHNDHHLASSWNPLQLLNKKKLFHRITQQDFFKRNSQNMMPMHNDHHLVSSWNPLNLPKGRHWYVVSTIDLDRDYWTQDEFE
ncbi:hypothetical protein ACFLQ1_00970 [Candidatus Auribacterota bacterium]